MNMNQSSRRQENQDYQENQSDFFPMVEPKWLIPAVTELTIVFPHLKFREVVVIKIFPEEKGYSKVAVANLCATILDWLLRNFLYPKKLQEWSTMISSKKKGVHDGRNDS
jgi:hypothetical protein